MQANLYFARTAAFITITCLSATINAQINQKSQSENKTPRPTNYGIYSIKSAINSRLIAANNTDVDYVRQTTVLVNWDGVKDGGIDYWCSHKKKVVLNINYNNSPSFFPTNLSLYKSKLQSFLNVYADSIELVVIENEELNNDTTHNLYHYGSVQDYINELTAAVSICIQKKIPITNGGLATQVAASLKHYYDINGKTDSSQWLVKQMGGITADPTVWKRCDSLLNAYKTLALSYVNLHWYEPKKGMTRITGVLQTLCNYITTRTGKKVITNETGTRSDSSFINQLMQQWSLVKPKYCICFDGDGSSNNNGTLPLTSPTGLLLPSGMAYRDYIGGGKACSQSITVSPSGFVNLCNNDTVKLTASNGFGNYLWNTGQTTQSIMVKGAGNYSVKSNHANCMAYTKSAAAVAMYAPPPQPAVTTNISPSLNICAGKSVKLTSSVASSYLWNTGETFKSISVINPGNYTVTISDANGCKTTSNITAVTYKTCAAPGALKVTGITTNNATLTWGSVSCAAGYQVQFRIKGTQPWTTQQLPSGITSSKTIYGLTAATYQWRMLTYCSYAPDTVKSAYIYGPEFTIKTTLNLANAIAANLDDIDIKIFPVPTRNIASVSVNPVRSNLTIKLMDIYGKVLWKKEKINDAITNLPVANLAAGVYLVVITDDEHSKTLTIIKE